MTPHPIRRLAPLLSFVVASCGGVSRDGEAERAGDGSCEIPEPCGGDLVGAWDLTEFCIDPESLNSRASRITGCPDLSPEEVLVDVHSGGVEFSTDGTSTLALDFSARSTTLFDAECLAAIGQPPASASNCREFGAERNDLAMADEGNDSVESIECSASGSACLCTVHLVRFRAEDVFRYRVEGDRVEDPETGDVMAYCVRNDRLWLFSSDAVAGAAYEFRRTP